jgi:hypothetical protein
MGDAVVDFNLTTGYDCLEAHLHKVLTYLSPMCFT